MEVEQRAVAVIGAADGQPVRGREGVGEVDAGRGLLHGPDGGAAMS
jgi:hypothetical protein